MAKGGGSLVAVEGFSDTGCERFPSSTALEGFCCFVYLLIAIVSYSTFQ